MSLPNKFSTQCEVVFLRHGIARKRNPTPEGDTMAFVHDEMSRELTQEGRAGVPYLGRFDLVIASPAARAIQTAMIASGRNPDKIITSLSTHLWPSAAGDNDWELVEKIFVYLRGGKDKKELVSLEEAYASASPEELRACQRISQESAAEVWSAIRQAGNCRRILVAGHMLHLQGTAQKMFPNEGRKLFTNERTIETTVLGRSESFFVTF